MFAHKIYGAHYLYMSDIIFDELLHAYTNGILQSKYACVDVDMDVSMNADTKRPTNTKGDAKHAKH